jgi:hypothetical protein
MDPAYKQALDTERAGLVNSPDRPAKYRRINEIDDQLEAAGFKVDRISAPADLEDTADRSPRERAVRPGRKES